jgi:hypothetical protein
MFDFKQEKDKFLKQIAEKEREKIMEDEIFNHVASYLRDTKDKVKKDKVEWEKSVNNKTKLVEEKKFNLEKKKEKKLKTIEETKLE